MEFNEKLQELRKRRGLTQEELASALFVSRTAVSKWESGRGYPGIDSLKAIAQFYSVTIDELLSGGELLSIAEEEQKRKNAQLCNLIFGLLDLCAAMFLFLPLFGMEADGGVRAVSLMGLGGVAPYLRFACFAFAIGSISLGILALVLLNFPNAFRDKYGRRISLVVNGAGLLLFIISSQPYAAVFSFVLLAFKLLVRAKKP